MLGDGGRGLGGGGFGSGGGGPARGVREPQRVKPSLTTELSETHEKLVPAGMNTLNGALLVPRYAVSPIVM